LQSVFDAVSTATAKGIIVVAAAGNGAVDLDGANCQGKFDTSVRKTRANIVGAGSSTDHARLGFSSYGSRVDLQGWGQNVTTTGYGGAFDPGDSRQRYTHTFSGTSSATPIVAGAVLAIQGVVKQCGLPPLTPSQIRDAMVSTGTPQSPAVAGHIGPLPRIKQALLASAPGSCVSAATTSALPASTVSPL
jgi:subtilisin family serine protease